jgi:ferrous iron transport protein A
VPGCRCRITALGGDPALVARLAQMGVLPGMELEVVRVAPLGGTVEVSLDPGQRLALRADELGELSCEPLVLPLSQPGPWAGRALRIRRLNGGRGFARRMAERRLLPGARIRIPDRPRSPLVVERDDGTAVRVGRGEARRILVEPDADG